MKSKRDYNVEIKDTNDHKYAYNFDFDVMHPYMIKSFEPFFNKGSLLELGSFKGDFTRRFLRQFDDVTCVEASDVAIEAVSYTHLDVYKRQEPTTVAKGHAPIAAVVGLTRHRADVAGVPLPG